MYGILTVRFLTSKYQKTCSLFICNTIKAKPGDLSTCFCSFKIFSQAEPKKMSETVRNAKLIVNDHNIETTLSFSFIKWYSVFKGNLKWFLYYNIHQDKLIFRKSTPEIRPYETRLCPPIFFCLCIIPPLAAYERSMHG